MRTIRRPRSTLALALTLVVATVLVEPGPDDAPVAAQLDDVAGDPTHWPIELTYLDDTGDTIRFRGTSWEDWSTERLDDGRWGLTDRHAPGEDFHDGQLLHPDDALHHPGDRAPSPHLGSSWLASVGLAGRVPADLDDVPDHRPLLDQLDVDAAHATVRVSPTVGACDAPLHTCLDGDGTATRAVIHQPTGLPLHLEHATDGRTTLLLQAVQLRWGDDDVTPVPLQRIPRAPAAR